MKKFFIVLAVLALAAGAHGQATRFADAEWFTPDAIDGDISDWPDNWYDTWGSNHGNNTTTTVPGAPDFYARWQMTHDADNLYLALEVTDDQRTRGEANWGGDCVEIYFDPPNTDVTTNGQQLRWYWDPTDGWVNEQGVGTGAVVDTGTMWTLEVQYAKSGEFDEAFPADALSGDAAFGFDIKVADNDDAADGANNRDENIFWGSEAATEHWNNRSSWGDVTLLPEAAAPPAEVANAPVAPTPPTLDGVISAGEWFGDWYQVAQHNFGSAGDDYINPPDFSAQWRAMHDSDNIYIALEVQDDNRQTHTNNYEKDGVEIYFDAANSKVFDYRPGNLNVTWSGTEWQNSRGDMGVTDDGTTYLIELAVGKDDLDRSIPQFQNDIGFDLKMADNDAGDVAGAREVNAFWGAPDTERENWNNAQGWGTLILADNWIRPSIPLSQIDAGSFLVLNAPDGSNHQWWYNGSELSGETGQTLTFNPVEIADAGDYQVTYNDGTNDLTTNLLVLEVLPEGSVPLASGLGLAALMGASALAGASILRRRKK